MVFPAQSGSKLWPSLCALGTRPTAIPILPLAFPTQSRTVPSPPAPSFICLFTGDPPRRTSCSCYSEIWECSSILKHLNYCTCDPRAAAAYPDAPLQAQSHHRGKKDICIVVIKDGREASHLFSHETLPFISAVQLVSVPALRLD